MEKICVKLVTLSSVDPLFIRNFLSVNWEDSSSTPKSNSTKESEILLHPYDNWPTIYKLKTTTSIGSAGSTTRQVRQLLRPKHLDQMGYLFFVFKWDISISLKKEDIDLVPWFPNKRMVLIGLQKRIVFIKVNPCWKSYPLEF